MAARKQIRRRIRRVRPVVRRMPSSSATAARVDAKESSSSDSGLMIGGAHDPAERAADQMADRVMRMPDSSAFDSSVSAQRKCEACEAEDEKLRRVPEKPDEEEKVQAKLAASAPVAAGGSAVAATPVASKAIRSMGAGKPIARADRAFFEPRFGADLSSVRIHDGQAADRASRGIHARAFTQGKNIAFAKGEFQPGSGKGRQLMAHEIAHVVSGDKDLHRKDDVCLEADAASHRSAFATEVAEAHAKKDDNRAVRAIKKLLRCDSTADDTHVHSVMQSSYGKKKTGKLIAASKTALGGHVGFYPKYAGDIKSRLKEIGVTDTEEHKTFATSPSGKKHRKRAAKAAKTAKAQLERADILYFRGHQFAQYRAPGMFTDGAEERGVDLRYLKRAGGFPNVKLMISTSCATLCNEAITVFTGLFPSAKIFGYGKSAPIEGKQVRLEFGKQVRALKSPLLLESASDVSKLTGAWKAAIEKRHPREKNAKKVRPGFYNGSKLFYWSGKAWVDGKKGDSTNNCKRKRNFSRQYPAPPTS